MSIESGSRLGAARMSDAVVEIRSPDGQKATLVVEAKQKIDPKDVRAALDQLRQYAGDVDQVLVVAPFLSRRTRQLLAGEGAGYADGTGNWRLALARPAVFIERSGAESNPWPERRRLHSLRGRAAGRVVRALCDFKPPYGVRDLAHRSNTPLASVARVVELLDREAIVVRQGRGPIEAVDWQALLHRWVQDYSFARTNRTQTFLEPRGLRVLIDKLAAVEGTFALTGSLAATELASVAPPRLGSVYVESLLETAARLDLRQVETGGNMILAEPFDAVVFDRSWTRHGLTFCGPSQIAADLLTSPGRASAEAEALIEWMGRNESAWRS